MANNEYIKSSRKTHIKKVLVLGSGALKIGQAGEFDYSGSQGIKALKEEGIETVLVNPNIATIQTSKGLADKIYFLPVNAYFVEKIIEKEKPDGIFLSFGGQTALNCGVELYEKGILEKNNVEVLGTPVVAIQKTEDRDLFNKELNKINVNVPRSRACNNRAEAIEAAKEIGFPLMIRAAFALGGMGSGFAYDEKQLEKMLENAFAYSPQVLVEENLKGWKEVEYEVVRDAYDNCVTVCNMENFDPLGIHTGESIVVAPSQTLTNSEYHKLREIGIKVIRHLGIVGECNIQYALDPHSEEYRVIEVNARLSRSSALASKATGYPLAHVAAKLALGYSLPELKNAVTQTTTACFEPALDYLALKIPRWDLNKFRMVNKEITSEMKSVGEIMALGRSFEEVIQKGLRMLQVGLHGLVANEDVKIESEKFAQEISKPTPKRILVVAEALKQGMSVDEIAQLSGIDHWFLDKLNNIVKMSEEIKEKNEIDKELMDRAKKSGFSDKQIGFLRNKEEIEIREQRKELGVLPSIKQIDTMAAEYPASTNYLYMTYHGSGHDVEPGKKKKVMVLGSGAYCIGSSVEFDWCCVNAVNTASNEGYETVMINYNPETVSTDYDICDKLYFDELSLERVLDIYEFEGENVEGVVVSTGGQVPNNLALKLHKRGVKILGTSPENIDRAENRHMFSEMLDKLGVDQPQWKELIDIEDIYNFVEEVGYPVLVRPSYVLSGAAMSVAYTKKDLDNFLGKAVKISKEAPVVVSKFETGAKEVEVDAVAHEGKVVIYAIAEHIENAGVHSGDATIVLPPQKLYMETIRRVKMITKKIAKELNISGPFNIQFLAKSNRVMVIECNLRSSRSFPFSSKVTGYNFIEIATYSMLKASTGKVSKHGEDLLNSQDYRTLDLDHVGVKAPQFSFPRLKGADPVMGVEMASTGEVGCFGEDLHEAFLKSMISVGFELPKKGVLFSIGGLEHKADLIATAKRFEEMGFKIFATEGTADFFTEQALECKKLHKVSSEITPNIAEAMTNREFDLIINIPNSYSRSSVTDGYLIRRKSVDLNIPLITNVQVAKIVGTALTEYGVDDLKIKDIESYF
ncbi:carbamoyl phosphate synthase large subunit [Candidatus Peregrinibacteria bacterium CG10_big_fil_rev_8_21_14_0_10_36_19]|nr:MAG: carbamoyl phosphate synthase large subunit [Candidatus Peregrinibacteria bacterium CG10_big_fil_rev_8_21_14_0_10_36_19]